MAGMLLLGFFPATFGAQQDVDFFQKDTVNNSTGEDALGFLSALRTDLFFFVLHDVSPYTALMVSS